MQKSKKQIKQEWIMAAHRFKPTAGLPVGASVFDDWLEVHLRACAAVMEEQGLEESLHKVRRAEVMAHNRMRPKDIHWQRDIEFKKELVDRILSELGIHKCNNVENIM
jgi:hypothetical protein